jgi:pentatricopeptide repeat protein
MGLNSTPSRIGRQSLRVQVGQWESSAITACAKGVGEALQLLIEMKQNRVKLDTITYSSAITACASKGESARAHSLYLEMESCGVDRDLGTHGAMMDACREMGGKKQEWMSCSSVCKRITWDGCGTLYAERTAGPAWPPRAHGSCSHSLGSVDSRRLCEIVHCGQR